LPDHGTGCQVLDQPKHSLILLLGLNHHVQVLPELPGQLQEKIKIGGVDIIMVTPAVPGAPGAGGVNLGRQ
jgi:hypothetical protein